ncbi:MAG TPA: hypothetical protein VI758_10605, partial [Bacteroidota bacterium]
KTRFIGALTSTLVLVVILTLVVSDNSSAQQRMRMSSEQRVAVLRDSLGLDSTQTANITVIIKEQQTEMQKIRESNQGNYETMRPAMQELGKKTDEKILAILNDTQKTKYQEMIKNRAMRRMGGMRGPGGNQ